MQQDEVQRVFIFDIDGTITEPRQQIQKPMRDALVKLSKSAPIVFVTGSPEEKGANQLGEELIGISDTFYEAGSNYYSNGKLIYEINLEFDVGVIGQISQIVQENTSYYKDHFSKDPNHIPTLVEKRFAMLNVSPLGHHKENLKHRYDYMESGRSDIELSRLIKIVSSEFPFNVTRGGQVSIDIYLHGKEQILKILKNKFPNANFIFFGDKLAPGGNDCSLAQALIYHSNSNVCCNVKGPNHTLELLNQKYF